MDANELLCDPDTRWSPEGLVRDYLSGSAEEALDDAVSSMDEADLAQRKTVTLTAWRPVSIAGRFTAAGLARELLDDLDEVVSYDGPDPTEPWPGLLTALQGVVDEFEAGYPIHGPGGYEDVADVEIELKPWLSEDRIVVKEDR